jgi:tRNA 2-selenouridine synthase SelU
VNRIWKTPKKQKQSHEEELNKERRLLLYLVCMELKEPILSTTRNQQKHDPVLIFCSGGWRNKLKYRSSELEIVGVNRKLHNCFSPICIMPNGGKLSIQLLFFP